MTNTQKFNMKNLWGWLMDMPKCEKGDYCNTTNIRWDRIQFTKDYSFVNKNYYCSKCGNKIQGGNK